jgi:hypothetical protein
MYGRMLLFHCSSMEDGWRRTKMLLPRFSSGDCCGRWLLT